MRSRRGFPADAFRDRTEAGKQLADVLRRYRGVPVLVLALPRGGVPVAYEVARALDAPLDVFLVRKLGTPGHEELAMGAIASGGVRLLNADIIERLRIPERAIDEITAAEERELVRRERAYREDLPRLRLEKRTVILVDDGLATGASMRAAVEAARRQHPERLVVAVPVGAADTCAELGTLVDEIVCLRTPDYFHAVGLWYQDFSEVSDEEVRELLEKAERLRCAA